MNYSKIYDSLISKNKNRVIDSTYEKHHIIPKCVGGKDNKDNLVFLTLKEHYVAHLLLCKIYPENYKLKYALWMMSNRCSKNKNSKTYQELKTFFIEKQKNRIVSELTKKKMSQSRLGKEPWNKGLKNPYKKEFIDKLKNLYFNKKLEEIYGMEKAEEIKKKLSKSKKGKPSPMKGKKMSLESNKKRSDSHKKIIKSKEWLDNISEAKKKPIYQLDLNGNLIKEWSCGKEASESLKISHSGISSVLNKRIKSYKKFIWKYKN